MDPAPPTAINPLDALRILRVAGGGLFSQAALHAQLAGVEWEEDKNRLLKMLAISLLGFACLLCGLLFAGGLALAAAWETIYRLPTFAALAILFGLGTLTAWRRFRALSMLGSQSFAATREELAADAAMLKVCA